MKLKVQCGYCSKLAKLTTGEEIYPHRKDLYSKFFWKCEPCGAYVGTHSESQYHLPLGRLANKNLRELKSQAHKVFDPIWKSGNKTRSEAYSWLASQLNINIKFCHIGLASESQCKRIIKICNNS